MFEWDENKRIANLKNHHLDFADADWVFDSPNRKTGSVMRNGERRWMDYAEVDGVVLVLVYTRRGDQIRVISYRRASRKERSAFHG